MLAIVVFTQVVVLMKTTNKLASKYSSRKCIESAELLRSNGCLEERKPKTNAQLRLTILSNPLGPRALARFLGPEREKQTAELAAKKAPNSLEMCIEFGVTKSEYGERRWRQR